VQYPALLSLPNVAAYRAHFEATYCVDPIRTFDGINVRFRKEDFDHCCFKSTKRNREKDAICPLRAERLDWIRVALQDRSSERYQGWDADRKAIAPHKRVALVMGDYVVIIRITGPGWARFNTAFPADSADTLAKIRSAPIWK
jgi:hypothetical protein